MAEASLGTFGDVAEEDFEEFEEQLEAEPVAFTLVGFEYKRTGGKMVKGKMVGGEHKRREFEFHVRPAGSFGQIFNVLQYVDAKGRIPPQVSVQFIYDALIDDDQDRFTRTTRDAAIRFSQDLLNEIAIALAELYGLRPSQPRSTRRAGSRPTGRTSTGGRSAKASTSRASTPRRRSTSPTR